MARILVVDDEPGIVTVLTTLLSGEGYDVAPTSDGVEAKRMLESSEPLDLMISDIRMNPIHGMVLLGIARERRPTMPVLMVTAFDSEQAAEEARHGGAFGYVAKPFDTEDILDKVAQALASQEV